jgi:hypothetical protein
MLGADHLKLYPSRLNSLSSSCSIRRVRAWRLLLLISFNAALFSSGRYTGIDFNFIIVNFDFYKYIDFIGIKKNIKKYQNNFFLSKLVVSLTIPKQKDMKKYNFKTELKAMNNEQLISHREYLLNKMLKFIGICDRTYFQCLDKISYIDNYLLK